MTLLLEVGALHHHLMFAVREGFHVETKHIFAERVLPRKAKGRLFGVADEQAVSILVALLQKEATFAELIKETRLSKTSLSNVLKRLLQNQIVERTGLCYANTDRGRRIVAWVLKAAEEESRKAMGKITERLSQLEDDYRKNRRVFHVEDRWERTGEKALIEVVSMRNMTGLESLLFQQKFQEEVVREELWLRSSISRWASAPKTHTSSQARLTRAVTLL